MTAEELFGVVDRDTRGKAKTVNFAILYGISSWGLAGRLGVPQGRGQGDHRPLFHALPRNPRLYRRDAGLRPREWLHPHPVRPQDPFPQHPRVQPNFRAGAERAAINAPIQGTSADLIKRAMNRMDDALADGRPRRRANAAAGP